jgi:hypothetical protein
VFEFQFYADFEALVDLKQNIKKKIDSYEQVTDLEKN